MNPPDDLQRLSALLDELLALPEAERVAGLGRRTGISDTLRARLRQLLEHPDEDLSLPQLSRYGDVDIAGLVGTGGTGVPAVTLQAGQRIGFYSLIREIGRGGMGAVWLAERADGTLKRQVALKLPHSADGDARLAERFVRERDILAALVHPNIARLYDAGFADDGQPYLAMEFVAGQPLGDYCRAHGLDLDARLRLFRQVLDAIQYAHSRLVVHRDIKPGNVLVTDEGSVRLLDFGIAKLLHRDASSGSEQTELGIGAFTPQYAAPEQLLGEPIATGTDIYSLGMLLYELLAGALPYRLKRATRGGLEEAILGVQPALPSEAGRGHVAWAGRLAGDIDTILLKALKKEPAERYLSAAAFAGDIDRYLAGEPVLARADSTLYRARKFVGRHRWGVAAVATVILALAGGLGATLWQAGVADRNAERAQKEALTAQAVKEFMRSVFYASSAQQADPAKARETTARELLDLGAARMDGALADAPEARQEMLMIFTELYSQIGMPERSLQFARQRVSLLREIRDVAIEDRVYALLLVAITLRSQSIDHPEQQTLLDEALTIVDGPGDVPPGLRAVVMTVAANYWADHDFPRALEFAHRAVEMGRGIDDFASISINAARADLLAGDAERARARAGEGIAATLAYNADQDAAQGIYMQLPPLYECLAQAEAALGDVAAAAGHFRQALQAGHKTFGDHDPEVVRIQAHLAQFLIGHDQRAEGMALLEEVGRALAQPATGSPRLRYEALLAAGEAEVVAGRFDAARTHVGAALAMRSQDIDASPGLAGLLRAQARALVGLGRPSEAATALARAVAMREKAGVRAADAIREEKDLQQRLLAGRRA